MLTKPISRAAAVALLLLLSLAACGDAGVGVGVIGPGGTSSGQRALLPGLYAYRAWSDYSRGGPAWSGYLELRVEAGGVITGFYRLPWQCRDAYRLEVDCVGRVGGRLYNDGTLRFGLDEGWLAHEGRVDRQSRVTGRWDTRILGYRDGGTFELLPTW
ncbi:MAG: hypothetical protein H0W11_15435 [Gemmatimonadetes bacterium]|nr:hypothetical protein [Gemmatimonadota bacterium]